MTRTIVEELIVKYGGDTKGIEAASQRASGAMQGFRKSTESVASSITRSFLQMATAYISFQGVIKTARIADEFTLLEARIKNATRGMQEFSRTTSGLRDIARDTGADLKTTVDVFQRISFVRDEIGATTDDMLLFTDTVSKLGVISGASTGALRAGLTQLGQSLSSEIVRAEEFNSIMENIPAVGVAIADSMGITTGQLRQLVIDGKVLSEDVFAAILQQVDGVNKKFDEMPNTINRAFARLNVNFGETVNLLNKSTGATKGFLAAVNLLNLSLEKFLDKKKRFDDLRKTIREEHNIDEAGNALPQFSTVDPEASINESLEQEKTNDLAEKYRKKLEEIGVEKDKTAKKSKTLKSAIDETTDSMKIQIGAIDMLVDALAEGGNAFENLRDVALQALSDIAKSMLKLSLGGQADSGIGGMIASGIMSAGFVSSSGTSGFSSRSFAELALAAGGGAFGPGFAEGGEFTVGGAGGRDSNLVAMRVSRGETVKVMTPQQAGAGGGVVVNQSFNISTGVAQTVRAELMRFMPAIKGQTIDGVEDAKRRGKI